MRQIIGRCMLRFTILTPFLAAWYWEGWGVALTIFIGVAVLFGWVALGAYLAN